jgi:hypothetical protein
LAILYPAYTPTPTRAAFFNLLFNFDFGLGGLPEPESFGFGLKTFVILSFNELPEPLELGLEPLGFGFKIFVILVFNELPEPPELELGLEPLDELGLEPLDELELGLELELPLFLA